MYRTPRATRVASPGWRHDFKRGLVNIEQHDFGIGRQPFSEMSQVPVEKRVFEPRGETNAKARGGEQPDSGGEQEWKTRREVRGHRGKPSAVAQALQARLY